MLQAGTDLSIEGFKGSAVGSRRSDPESVGDLAERCAIPQEQQRGLGIRKGGQLPEQGPGLVHTFGHGEGLAEGRGADGSSKEGESTRGVEFDTGGEGTHVNAAVGATTADHLTLPRVQLEADLARCGGEAGKGRGNPAIVACKANVV